MNKFIVVGRLARDSELRYTKDNKEICNFTLAIANSKDDTTFLKVSTFGKVAETVNKYIKKGDLILVEGMIKNNNYTDKDGNKHFEYVFMGNRAEFLSPKGNLPKKEEQAQKEPKNDLSDEAFAEFGKKIEISDDEVAF